MTIVLNFEWQLVALILSLFLMCIHNVLWIRESIGFKFKNIVSILFYTTSLIVFATLTYSVGSAYLKAKGLL